MKNFLRHYRFGTVRVRHEVFPSVLLGTSPFIGAGQFGDKSYFYHQHFYENPDNIVPVLEEGFKLGCNAVQLIAYPALVRAVERTVEKTNIPIFVLATVGLGDLQAEIADVARLNPQCLLIHGAYTDKNFAGIDRHLKMIRERFPKMITGVATHNPGIIIEKAVKIPNVDVILSPFNKSGIFMRPSQEMTIEAVAAARKAGCKVFAMKTLAAGTIPVHEAFGFLKNQVHGLTVGLASTTEIRETLDHLRKLYPPRRR
ncbi:MAG: hypothetical protein RDV41_00970 [Planctomycetota bacterium]|nr:hypothetical protein [Planctomycetota bacterium]